MVNPWHGLTRLLRPRRQTAEQPEQHRHKQLVIAADWAITTANRRASLAPDLRGRVTVADVIAQARDQFNLDADPGEAAAVLRARYELRGSAYGLSTDAYESR